MQISQDLLCTIVQQSGPVKLVIGGPPCEDLALVNADATGVKGSRSGLLHYFFIVLDLLKMIQPEQEVFFLAENTRGMADHNKSYINKRFGAHDELAAEAIGFNSLSLGAVSRLRLYWTNIPGVRAHMAQLSHGPKNHRQQLIDVLDPGRTSTALYSDCILATGQKGRPVMNSDGGAAALNPTEVERLMAIEGYTDRSGLSKPQRLKVLGESWHLNTIVELMRPLASVANRQRESADWPTSLPHHNLGLGRPVEHVSNHNQTASLCCGITLIQARLAALMGWVPDFVLRQWELLLMSSHSDAYLTKQITEVDYGVQHPGLVWAAPLAAQVEAARNRVIDVTCNSQYEQFFQLSAQNRLLLCAMHEELVPLSPALFAQLVHTILCGCRRYMWLQLSHKGVVLAGYVGDLDGRCIPGRWAANLDDGHWREGTILPGYHNQEGEMPDCDNVWAQHTIGCGDRGIMLQTTPPSLWSLSAADTIQSLQSALSELEPAAVSSGWFQEGEIVDAIYSLDTDINRLALSRMFLSTHPYEDVHTLQNGHPTNVFTQEAFGSLMFNCVERLHSLQLVVFRTPFRIGCGDHGITTGMMSASGPPLHPRLARVFVFQERAPLGTRSGVHANVWRCMVCG